MSMKEKIKNWLEEISIANTALVTAVVLATLLKILGVSVLTGASIVMDWIFISSILFVSLGFGLIFLTIGLRPDLMAPPE